MSGGTVGAYIVGGAIAAASAAASVYSSNKQAKAQEAASKRAEQQAKEQAAQQRKQGGQSADVGSILDQNTNAGLSGGSTLLTGAGGVGDLNLGAGGKLG